MGLLASDLRVELSRRHRVARWLRHRTAPLICRLRGHIPATLVRHEPRTLFTIVLCARCLKPYAKKVHRGQYPLPRYAKGRH